MPFLWGRGKSGKSGYTLGAIVSTFKPCKRDIVLTGKYITVPARWDENGYHAEYERKVNIPLKAKKVIRKQKLIKENNYDYRKIT